MTLEAAASGVPVIAATTSGLVDSVREGVTGIFVSSRDEADWAIAIRGLLSDAPRLAPLRESAAAYGAEHTWAEAADAHLNLYRALLASNSSRRAEPLVSSSRRGDELGRDELGR